MAVELVGVPFSSTGRPDGIAAASAVLRSCNLAERLGEHVALTDGGELELANQTPDRAPGRLRNETGLVSLMAKTRAAVGTALRGGKRPLLVGGDCPVMLGALAAMHDHAGPAGLVMIDGRRMTSP